MRYMILIFMIVFLSACSPKYKVVKEYVAPKISNGNSSVCLGLCQSKKSSCKSSCKRAFDSCKPKALKVANKRYEQKMKEYIKALEDYANQAQRNDFDLNFAYIGPIGRPYYYDSPYYRDHFFMDRMFWYEPRYNYLGPKPKKPTLEAEKLKAEGEICDLDCGCSDGYDECFMGCGGSVLNKKVCIENCPDER